MGTIFNESPTGTYIQSKNPCYVICLDLICTYCEIYNKSTLFDLFGEKHQFTARSSSTIKTQELG